MKFRLPFLRKRETLPVFEQSRLDENWGLTTQFPDSVLHAPEPVAQVDIPLGSEAADTQQPPAQPPSNRMGQAFIAAGKLTAEQVQSVLRLQTKTRIRFGEAAIKLGYLTEQEVSSVLAKQFNFQLLDNRGALLSGRISKAMSVAHRPYSAEAEGFRRLRAEVLQRMQGKQTLSSISVVGSQRKDGVSHVAASLAITLSQVNRRTLLIDANLRSPSVDRIFGISSRYGLSTLLAGRESAQGREVHAITERLSVLPAGPKPPNPLEILDPPSFQLLLERFAGQFDVVVVDTPAAWETADALVISVQCDHVLMVVREGASLVEKVQKVERSLQGLDVNPMGVFYNRVPAAAAWWQRRKDTRTPAQPATTG